jgi:hypothetical protein
MRRRLWIPAAALMAVACLFIALWWSSPSRQARQWCLRTQAAIAAGDAAALVAELHPDYDPEAHWPDLGGGVLALMPGAATPRERFAKLLAVGFASRRDQPPLRLTLGLRQAMPADHGRVIMLVDVAMDVPGGGGPRIEPVRSKRFVLARQGWSPRLTLVDHEDVTLAP